MKLPMLSLVAGCLSFAFAPNGSCQLQKSQPERPHLKHTTPPRLYFSMPQTENAGRVELEASNAQIALGAQPSLTSAEIELILQLRGNVQVRMCSPTRYGCENGSLLLRANAVDYNETTREIDAHGNVRIVPVISTSPH